MISRSPEPTVANGAAILGACLQKGETATKYSREPDVTRRLRAAIQDAMNGTMRPGDFTADLWKQLGPVQKETQADMKRQGDLASMVLVDRSAEGGKRSYRYIVEFKNVRALQRIVLDEHGEIELLQSEGGERKPDAPDEPPRP